MKRKVFFWFVAGIFALGLVPGFAGAADVYPSRPIQVIVPFPPGGVADLVARPFASVLEKELKQPVVVVNKTGAGGAVGMQSAAVARPDGYTFKHLGHAGSRFPFRPSFDL
jgi:tripartite-type tricarboxylate transporter receptor subunit TctC